MSTPVFPWLTQFADMLRGLARRPGTLLLVVLAVNAVMRPYAGIFHDARLYSVQAVNAADPGLYADDLYFQYGSQDRYSAFSPLMGPLCARLGVHRSFFLVYAAANVLFFWAVKRFLERLTDDRALSTFALLCVAAMPLPYGGMSVFHIHEAFLTPRLPAEALTALALSFVLEGRYRAAGAPLVAAGLLHPLVATGGVLLWSGCLVYEKLGGRWLVWLAAFGGAGVIAFLASPALAMPLLGGMDDEWRDAIRRATPMNYPDEWLLNDWLGLALSGLGTTWLALDAYRTRSRRASFRWALMLVGVMATVGTVIVPCLPYALPFQGQPYRALWILRLVAIPGCLALAAALWRSERLIPGCLAVLLIDLLLRPYQMPLQWLFPVLLLPLTLLACRGLEEQPRHPAWVRRGVAWAFLLGAVGWSLYCLSLLFVNYDLMLARVDTLWMWPYMVACLGPATLLLACALALWAVRQSRIDGLLGPAALVLLAAMQFSYACLPRLDYVQRHHSRYMPDVRFARASLQRMRDPDTPLPTIYCSLGEVEYVWLDLQSKCYFDRWQTSGFIFQRATAMEGERRAALVAPFEMQRFRTDRDSLGPKARRDIEKLLQMPVDGPAPTVDDLRRLCAEPNLDYVILQDGFAGLYAATNDRVYIYDCRQVRAFFQAHGSSAVPHSDSIEPTTR